MVVPLKLLTLPEVGKETKECQMATSPLALNVGREGSYGPSLTVQKGALCVVLYCVGCGGTASLRN